MHKASLCDYMVAIDKLLSALATDGVHNVALTLYEARAIKGESGRGIIQYTFPTLRALRDMRDKHKMVMGTIPVESQYLPFEYVNGFYDRLPKEPQDYKKFWREMLNVTETYDVHTQVVVLLIVVLQSGSHLLRAAVVPTVPRLSV